MPSIIKNGRIYNSSAASEITYNNTSSGLLAENTQAAIDEVNNKIPVVPDHYDAEDIIYDNTSSELASTDVQSAIDELAENMGSTAEDTTFDDTDVTFSANNVQSAFENIIKKLTQAQYDALTPAEQLNGTIYFIVDGGPPTPTSNAGVIAASISIRSDTYTEESL